MKEDEINRQIREHESSVPWDYQSMSRVLYDWWDVFNREFFNSEMPQSLLRFGRTRWTTLGHYHPGRNEVGALHEINLNPLHLDRPLIEILVTLLHELVHEWQELWGNPGKGGYHNRQFVTKCRGLGIPCTGGYRSYSTGYSDPFLSLLRAHGVEVVVSASRHGVPLQDDPQPAKFGGSSRLKKWRCGCTSVWTTMIVQAQCLHCGALFERSTMDSQLNAKASKT